MKRKPNNHRYINNNYMYSILITVLLPALFVVFTACGGEKEVRKYQEEQPTPKPGKLSMSSPHTGGMPGSNPAMQPHFKWDVPTGWTEEPKTGGMRLATFSIKTGGKTAECTMIPLSGDAGGLQANVERWLDQVKSTGTAIPDKVNADTLMKNHLEKFLTKAQFPGELVDFTPVTPKPTDQTFIVAVIPIEGASVFVKLMGEKSILAENKGKFKALCESFAFNTAPGK